MNTCKSISKQRTLSPFRMNTCEKTGGRGAPSSCSSLPFADQISAPIRPHLRGVHRSGRHVASVTRAVPLALATHSQGHLTAQNDVRGFRRMRVGGIGRVRRTLPHIGLTKSLLLEALRQFHFVHNLILAAVEADGFRVSRLSGSYQKVRVHLVTMKTLNPF